MGIVQVFSGTLSDVLASQWKSVIEPEAMGERTLLAPGVQRRSGKGGFAARDAAAGSGTIVNGSVIYVPENTVAFVIAQGSIEVDIDWPGGFEYQLGRQRSIFNRDGFDASVTREVKRRVGFGGEQPMRRHVVYVNMREVDGLRFGMKVPLRRAGSERYLKTHGTFSVRVVDAGRVLREFLTAGTQRYELDDAAVRSRLLPEFQQSFAAAVNRLAQHLAAGDLQMHVHELVQFMRADAGDAAAGAAAGTAAWPQRWGIELANMAIGQMRAE